MEPRNAVTVDFSAFAAKPGGDGLNKAEADESFDKKALDSGPAEA